MRPPCRGGRQRRAACVEGEEGAPWHHAAHGPASRINPRPASTARVAGHQAGQYVWQNRFAKEGVAVPPGVWVAARWRVDRRKRDRWGGRRLDGSRAAQERVNQARGGLPARLAGRAWAGARVGQPGSSGDDSRLASRDERIGGGDAAAAWAGWEARLDPGHARLVSARWHFVGTRRWATRAPQPALLGAQSKEGQHSQGSCMGGARREGKRWGRRGGEGGGGGA